MPSFSKRSTDNLKGVHPDLVRVLNRAIQTHDFTVIEGVRTRARMMENYGKGRTAAQCIAKGIPASYAKPGEAKVTWLNDPFASAHAIQGDGFGHAIDAVPVPCDWNNTKAFDAMAAAILAAAKAEGVSIRWGADWDKDGRARERGETDSPHFELHR